MEYSPCRSGGSWGGEPVRDAETPPPPLPRHERRWSTYPPSSSSSERGSGGGDMTEQAVARAKLLEGQVAAAKQTEMKMLESLILQTRELEQAQVALDDAKLEIAALRRGAPPQWSVMDLVFGGVDEEINGLRGKLRATVLAEERSRKTADELAAALSAVTMEAKQVKAWLSDTQAEVESADAEVSRLQALLHTAEAEMWSATEQLDCVTGEWKDAAAAWRVREKVLLGRVHENAELHRVVNDENTKLRDAMAEKDATLERLRQENEALKTSEAAAQGHIKHLDDQLSAAAAATKTATGAADEKASDPPSEKWRGVMQGKLSAPFLDESGRVMASRKDRMFASLSNIAELRSAAAAAAMDDDYEYEFDHLDSARQHHLEQYAMKHGKRRSVLRKFGDFFKRKSLYKSRLGPELRH